MNAAAPALLAGSGTALIVAAVLRRDPLPAGRRRNVPAFPGSGALSRRLRRGGIPVPAAAAAGGVAAATLAAALLAIAMGSWAVAALAPVAVPGAAHLVLAARERRYPDRVAAQLPGVLRATADGIAAGRSLRRALA
ncbi:MAG: hypothetical protein IT200_11975, partial [Thermoleophilia bacterium]|nr:hypothetical protein [Thermoleophilia bacterium]